MPALLRLRPSAPVAASILEEVFASLRTPLAFRLWEGTEVRLGRGEPACTVVVHQAETFAGLMRDPSPGHFAEAYVSGAIDLEGDLYKTMHVANAIEGLELSARERLRIATAMLRG